MIDLANNREHLARVYIKGSVLPQLIIPTRDVSTILVWRIKFILTPHFSNDNLNLKNLL